MIKKEIIIFRKEEPSYKEVCDIIAHFCREHSREYERIGTPEKLIYQIDGKKYKIQVCKEQDAAGWRICCMCF